MLTKRPLMCISLAFVAGMYILSVFNYASLLLFSVCAVFSLLLVLLKKANKKNTIILLLCAITFILGSTRYYVSDNIKNKILYEKLEKTITIDAQILEEVKITDTYVSFIGKALSVADKDGKQETSDRVMFYCYFNEKQTDVVNLKIGDVVTIKDKIKLPKSPMNTGGFDYVKYLKTDRTFFQCNTDFEKVTVTGHIHNSILTSWNNFRNKCTGFFDNKFPEREAGVLKAYITGDKSGITFDVKESFSISGLSHILAVSGLHVSVFISIVASILKLFNLSKRKQIFVSAFCALFFVLFTGASVSALRAGAMCIFALVAKLIYRKADPITTLSLSAAVFCIFNPHTIHDISFMLSFGATAGILLFYEGISRGFSRIYKNLEKGAPIYRLSKNFFDSLAVGFSAQIFVIPLLVYIFNRFSPMSIIATMAVTPLLTSLLAGGLIFIALSFISGTLAYPAAGFIYLLSKVMIWISDIFGSFSFSQILFGKMTPFLILMYTLLIGVLWFLLKKEKKWYIIFLVSFTILSVIGLSNAYSNYNTAQVSFINVGQGDCALIKAPGDCDILIDAGGTAQNEKIGENVIAPYLIKNGVTDIEYIVISHTDKDHIVGLNGIIATMNVDNLILPYGQQNTENGKNIIKTAKENGVKVLYFTSRDAIKINEKITLTAITPDFMQRLHAKDDNDTGTVVRLDYGETSFLFTGDMSSDIEKYLMSSYPDMLEADVLKVGHHGSKYSTCQEFLDIVKPEYSYIPVGTNTYGHPTPEVLERLKSSDIEVYRADVHRDVTFYFDDTKIKGVIYNKTREGA